MYKLSQEQIDHILGPLLINWVYDDLDGKTLTKSVIKSLVGDDVGTLFDGYDIDQQSYDSVP